MTAQHLAAAAALLLATAAPSAAQVTNPCTASASTTAVANPTRLAVVLPDHTTTLPNGDPAVSAYQVALFAQGANPATATPLQGPSAMPKTAFTLVTDGCYTASVPMPAPSGQTVVVALRAVRAATPNTPAAESPWSAVSNGFFLAPVPAAPGRPVVTP